MRCTVSPARKGRDRSRHSIGRRTRVQKARFRENETASCCLTLHPAGERIRVNCDRSKPQLGKYSLQGKEGAKRVRRGCEDGAQHAWACSMHWSWTRARVALSTMNASSTVFLGKYSHSQIAVDRRMVMNSMESGMSTVNEGPRWRMLAAKGIASVPGTGRFVGVQCPPLPSPSSVNGAAERRASNEHPISTSSCSTRQSLLLKLQSPFSSYSFPIIKQRQAA